MPRKSPTCSWNSGTPVSSIGERGPVSISASLSARTLLGNQAQHLSLQKMPTAMSVMNQQRLYQEYYRRTAAQEQQAARILGCYLCVKRENRLEVWKDAQQRGLFHDENSLSTMRSWHQEAQGSRITQEAKEEANRKADRRYASEIFIADGTASTRTEMMEAHRQKVCELARNPVIWFNRGEGYAGERSSLRRL